MLMLVFLYKKELLNVYKKSPFTVHRSLFTAAVLLLPMFYQLLNPIGQARYGWVEILDQGSITKIEELRNNSSLPEVLDKIIFNRKECIGTGACATMVEKFWEIDNDDKANLIGSKLNEETGFFELDVDEDSLDEAIESMKVCPVKVISVYKIEKDVKLIKLDNK